MSPLCLTGASLDGLDFASLQVQMEVNAFGPLRVIKAVDGNLVEGSKIANITSRMGSIADNGSGGMYGYRMSKAALNMATKVRANCSDARLVNGCADTHLVCPGFTVSGP